MEFKAHLFVCVNNRGPDKKESCGLKGAQELKDEVKRICQEKGIKNIRINNSGCLGPCEKGINAVLYPNGEWFHHLKKEDSSLLVNAVEKACGQPKRD